MVIQKILTQLHITNISHFVCKHVNLIHLWIKCQKQTSDNCWLTFKLHLDD